MSSLSGSVTVKSPFATLFIAARNWLRLLNDRLYSATDSPQPMREEQSTSSTSSSTGLMVGPLPSSNRPA